MDNDNNNSFKTILWIVLGLVIIVIVVVLLTKKKNVDEVAENIVIGEAVVEKIDIAVMESFPVQISVLATGYLPDGCTTVGDVKQRYGNGTFDVTLESKKPLDAQNCTQAIVPFEKNFSLSGVVGLPKGTYAVDVNGVRGQFTLDVDNFISETDPLK